MLKEIRNGYWLSDEKKLSKSATSWELIGIVARKAELSLRDEPSTREAASDIIARLKEAGILDAGGAYHSSYAQQEIVKADVECRGMKQSWHFPYSNYGYVDTERGRIDILCTFVQQLTYFLVLALELGCKDEVSFGDCAYVRDVMWKNRFGMNHPIEVAQQYKTK